MIDFHRVALVGAGLLGGSLGMALRRLANPPEVTGWARRPETVALLESHGCVDRASGDLDAVVEGADLVVLATPVGAMPDLARRLAGSQAFSDSTVVTDVGSVKQCVVDKLVPLFDGAGRGRFVGSHPMAGSEKDGVGAARVDLFDGATCLLTPVGDTNKEALVSVEKMWRAIGMQTVSLGAAEHDTAVAKISHLPHIVAAAQVLGALDEELTLAKLAGPGFRDSTRIAAGPVGMWTEILLENRQAVAAELRNLQERLGETLAFLDNVNEEDLRRFLGEAKRRRDLFSAEIETEP